LNTPLDQLTTKIHSKLEECGHTISKDWTYFYAQLFQDFLLNTKEGREYVVNLYGLEWFTGESDSEYKLADTDIVVPGDEVYFLNAAVVRGNFVRPSQLDEYQIITEKCDMCGVHVHCYVEDDKLFPEGITKVCSYCIKHTEEYRDFWDYKCPACTVTKCPNHRLYTNDRRYENGKLISLERDHPSTMGW
jgi:hypothetical protein